MTQMTHFPYFKVYREKIYLYLLFNRDEIIYIESK